MTPAVFFDRDGTLNVEKHYLHQPELLEVYPEAGPALRRLRNAGYALFIVTNQAGIGRGYYSEDAMHSVHDRLQRELAAEGVEFHKIYFAPEAPHMPSRGRKPSPQFLLDAQTEFNLDLGRSYMVGDKVIDLEAGWNAGCAASILVRTGYGAEVERKEPQKLARAVVCDHVGAAADWILAQGATTAPASAA